MNALMRSKILWIKEKLKRLIHLRASPHQIALGAAIGVFIGIAPTFGFGAFLVLGLAPLIRFNIAAAFIAGTLLCNPLFAPVWIFLSCFVVGIDFTMIKATEKTIESLLGHYSSIFGMYVCGSLILSAAVAVVMYGMTRMIVHTFRKRAA